MMARLEEVRLETYQQILGNASADFLNSDVNSEADRQFTSLLSNANSNELPIRILFSCLVDADYLDTETHFNPEQAEIRKENKLREDLNLLVEIEL